MSTMESNCLNFSDCTTAIYRFDANNYNTYFINFSINSDLGNFLLMSQVTLFIRLKIKRKKKSKWH